MTASTVPNTSKIICVTGMHRSGTSLFMAWLEQCGLQITDGALVPSSGGNERGHFEDKEFVDLHWNVIARDVPRSKGWIVTSVESLDDLELDLQVAEALIQTRNQKYDAWGWKDPRTILFIDQWKARIPQLKTIFMWRSCPQVVYSLYKRCRRRKEAVMKINPIDSVKLWLLSNNLALDFYRRYPEDCIILSLPQLLKDDAQILQHINGKFDAALVHEPLARIYSPSMIQQTDLPFWCHLVGLLPSVRKLSSKLAEVSCSVTTGYG